MSGCTTFFLKKVWRIIAIYFKSSCLWNVQLLIAQWKISRSCVSFTSMRVDIFSWNLYIFPIIPFELIFRELSAMIMLRVDKISLQWFKTSSIFTSMWTKYYLCANGIKMKLQSIMHCLIFSKWIDCSYARATITYSLWSE